MGHLHRRHHHVQVRILYHPFSFSQSFLEIWVWVQFHLRRLGAFLIYFILRVTKWLGISGNLWILCCVCENWLWFCWILWFRNLPRHQFGNLQSKMFPAYFSMVGVCCAVSVASFGYLHPWKTSSTTERYQLGFLLSSFAFNLTNLFVFTPMTIEVKINFISMASLFSQVKQTRPLNAAPDLLQWPDQFDWKWRGGNGNLKWQIDWYKLSLGLFFTVKTELLVCVYYFLYACIAKSVCQSQDVCCHISCTFNNSAVAKYVKPWVSVV